MQKIIECVPNFSEGRRPEIYNAIGDAIARVPAAHVLDVSADSDHNRSVITFAGAPEAVQEAAFQAIATAARLIDLDKHTGEHPRIGATDVCPFIPVKNATVEECVEIANAVGRRVGEELSIAVYLYGEAATRPERKKLADIRRGQYELWKQEIGVKPDRAPDYGPAVATSAGATVIGVRPFLIAYNIFLNSSDVAVANKIARAVRFSSGGLRHVQALGFLVDGQAQVSMNLTDFTKTPLHAVQEMVRREAGRYGLAITRAELIGLAPQSALLEAAKWYCQIDELREDQVLEIRLEEALSQDYTPHAFLEATASATPTPGGGSSAALAGALAAALSQMVANLTLGRKKYAAVQSEITDVSERASRLRNELTAAVSQDAEAFNSLMAAWRDKDLEGEQKALSIEKATRHAGEVPLGVARLSREAAELALAATTLGNINAVTDAAAAAVMARSAVQIAAMNVKINALGLRDQALALAWREELDSLEAEAESLSTRAIAVAAERGGF
jgi:glutamate formiminotransferase/formiminotetrahydrofolate cyclodeaminase